nr:MAG TPA: hypothetical protein [Caudoviricetes sp.]
MGLYSKKQKITLFTFVKCFCEINISTFAL